MRQKITTVRTINGRPVKGIVLVKNIEEDISNRDETIEEMCNTEDARIADFIDDELGSQEHHFKQNFLEEEN